MQLTPFRWVLIAAIIGGGGAIAAAPAVAIVDGPVARRASFETKTSIDLVRRSRRASTSLNRLSADWMREVAAPVAAHTKPGTPVIPSRGALDSGTATPDTMAWTRLTATRDSLESLRTRFAAGSLGDVGVAITTIGAPFALERSQFSASAVLPERLNGSTCVVVADAAALRPFARRGNGFGPCFWYGAFGVPGRAAREWLSATGYLGSGQINGDERSNREARLSMAGALAAMPRSFSEITIWSSASLQLAVCVARGGDSCGKLETDAASLMWTRFGGTLVNRYGVVSLHKSFEIDLNRGPGDLYSEFGADRFAKLWRSPLPFPEAFEESTGQPLNEYMRRAAIRTVGGTLHPGPQVDGATLLLLLIAISVLLAVTFFPSARPAAQ